ncbi:MULTISPECIES: hypothetical protein [unclassified Endozoicomonas]|uniref:hypothetical protein n=1 Tax=unclassified Endozoicomonas TaxID=2644528 RepID=UPI003BB6D313
MPADLKYLRDWWNVDEQLVEVEPIELEILFPDLWWIDGFLPHRHRNLTRNMETIAMSYSSNWLERWL